MMDQGFAMSEESSWKTHLQTLRQQFQHVAQGRCLLWVNPAQGDPFDDLPSIQTQKVLVPIIHPRFDLKYAPYLVPLDLENIHDADVFQMSVQLACDSWSFDRLQAFRGQPIAGWIRTDATPKLLAHHWATYSYLHANNGLTKLLRFHDPSVREWLWPILSGTQQEQLLGPAISLIAVSREQRLMVHGGDLATDAVQKRCANDRVPRVNKLNLTPHQWHQVNDYAAVHAAWIAWCSMQAENGSTAEHRPDWRSGVFDALRHATAYGITAPDDRELFATHALQYGAQFHLHPKLKFVWEKTLVGDSYGSAFEEVYGQNVDPRRSSLEPA